MDIIGQSGGGDKPRYTNPLPFLQAHREAERRRQAEITEKRLVLQRS